MLMGSALGKKGKGKKGKKGHQKEAIGGDSDDDGGHVEEAQEKKVVSKKGAFGKAEGKRDPFFNILPVPKFKVTENERADGFFTRTKGILKKFVDDNNSTVREVIWFKDTKIGTQNDRCVL